VQVIELFLHLAVPCGLCVEAEVSKGGFHIRLGTGSWLQRAHGVLCGDKRRRRWQGGGAEPPPASTCPFKRR
jgi:hypothetical protein